jgi:nitrate/nitrite transporter NarK
MWLTNIYSMWWVAFPWDWFSIHSVINMEHAYSLCWITCHFTQQVVGTAMAISGGWGASGAGFVQLVVGTIIYPTCI